MTKQPTTKTEQKAKPALQKKLKAIEKLYAADIDTSEKLQQMTALEMSPLPGAVNDDVRMMLDIQQFEKAACCSPISMNRRWSSDK